MVGARPALTCPDTKTCDLSTCTSFTAGTKKKPAEGKESKECLSLVKIRASCGRMLFGFIKRLVKDRIHILAGSPGLAGIFARQTRLYGLTAIRSAALPR